MSTANPIVHLHTVGLDHLKRHWGWFFALGVALAILGTMAIMSATTTLLLTKFAVTFVGWLMIVTGVLEVLHSFTVKRWGGFFIDLLLGMLYAVVGFMIVANPQATAITLTLLIAMFLIFGGLFRIVIALANRYRHWLWLLLSGVINVVLGVLIWQQWPYTGLWVIGLFVGIDMIFYGWSLIMLSLAAKNLPAGQNA